MKIITQSLLAVGLSTALFVGLVQAAPEIGKPAPDFALTDITGKQHKLSDYRGKIVVLEWVNPECPIVVNHYDAQNMQSTQKAAAADGAVWLQINSASYPGAQGDYDPAQVKSWQSKVGAASTAYLRDQTGKVGKLYHATNTPHLFIIDQGGTLVYQGAIDSGNSSDIPTAKNYVKAALESLKAGKPIEKAATRAYGCNVKYGS